jgi:hypothetical protein
MKNLFLEYPEVVALLALALALTLGSEAGVQPTIELISYR